MLMLIPPVTGKPGLFRYNDVVLINQRMARLLFLITKCGWLIQWMDTKDIMFVEEETINKRARRPDIGEATMVMDNEN